MRKLYHRFVDVLQVLSAALLLLMLGVVLVGIFYRYVVDESLSWYDEFAGYIPNRPALSELFAPVGN